MRKDSKTMKAQGELYMLRVAILAVIAQHREIRHPSDALLQTCDMLQGLMQRVTDVHRNGNMLEVETLEWEQIPLDGFEVDLDGLIVPPENREG